MEILKNIKWYHVTIVCLILIILYFVCSSNSPRKYPENFEEQKNVHALKKDNANAEIILYYALWCGYSRQFLPEWEKFEAYAKEKLPHLRVMRMRCEDGDEATCQQKGIEGYPTVVIYLKDGTEKVFDGPRKMESLIEFVNNCANLKN